MSLPQGGFERREGFGRRRAIVWCAVVLALLAVWSSAVLSWGGGDSQGASGRGASRGEAGESSERGSGQSRGFGAASVPDEPAYAEAGAFGEETPTVFERQPQEPIAGPMSGGNHSHPEGGEGASNEPGSYDPLGVGASPGDLAATDEARVRYAAWKFVAAAYGYTGSDGAEYLAGVAAVSLSPDLSLSEGGPEISRYAEQVNRTGTKSAAKLTRFDFDETSPDSATGYAYFETGEDYGPDGELTGEKLAYRQRMALSRVGEKWKVEATEEIEEISNDEEASSNAEER